MKLARSSKIKHKLGINVSTPLLVPSFSSKGLGFIPPQESLGFRKDHEKPISEASQIIASVNPAIANTALVSAFDISQEFIPSPEKLPINVELLFVDSGGYETSNYYDLSELFKGPPYKHDWNQEEHLTILDKWPDDKPSVFVSFDQNINLELQIESAQKLGARFPKQLSTLLMKPEKKTNKLLPLDRLAPLIDELNHFDIIGVTEKELGHSILKRMVSLAELRIQLDKAGIDAPIHVFGSLDPVTTCLYFLAGAEIFDGLTWSRMSYRNGSAIYHANNGALYYGIHESDDQVKIRALFDNIYYLDDLRERMEEFANSGNFKVFPFNSDFLEKAFNTLKTKIK